MESELDEPLDDSLSEEITPLVPEVITAAEAEEVDVATAAPPMSAEVVIGPPV